MNKFNENLKNYQIKLILMYITFIVSLASIKSLERNEFRRSVGFNRNDESALNFGGVCAGHD